ncbi:MAG: prepilin-type N-terminal cleavage/methylation domain-containing protein [Patescibacteria group bacterium]
MQNAKLRQKGFGLLEVLVGLTILSVSFFALLVVSRGMLAVSRETAYNLQADYLLEEGVEALRSIRDQNWATYITPLSGTNYLVFEASPITRWTTTSTPEIIDSFFNRGFVISDVYRDSSSDDIADSGTFDPDTKKFVVSVDWQGRNGTTTRSVSTYLTNYFND